MDNKQQLTHILQIGSSNWQDQVDLPAGLGWHFFQVTALPSLKDYMEEEEISKFKALILEKPEDLLALGEDLTYFQPYTVFYDDSHQLETPSEELAHFLTLKQARPWDFSNKPQFLYVIERFLYDNQYGDSFMVGDLQVRPDFAGQQTVLGQHFLKLDGAYGEEFTPIVQWVYNYVYDASRPINFWLEYEKDPSCQVQLRIQFYRRGGLGDWVKDAVFSEEEMQAPLELDGAEPYYLAFSLEAKGEGMLTIGALHKRLSHGPLGGMTLGAQTLRDRKRQEIFAYFHPGD
ncbi:MAG: accessory Sec system protein Asp2, partial [Streptococcus parasanguinis]|nr:accessory Sec system protein Asp2 [Streptococcus parasanguinis]